jgi:micrococcal nuclease
VPVRRALGLAVLLASCGGSKCGPPQAVVSRVIDGDTLVLESGERVRLLLVDTPEITQGKHDCYGPEAAAFTASLVTGRSVALSYDEAACTDRYGRTLAYVTAGGIELNAALVTRGYGCALYIAPGGEARREAFARDEAEARTERRGLWGACASIPCSR